MLRLGTVVLLTLLATLRGPMPPARAMTVAPKAIDADALVRRAVQRRLHADQTLRPVRYLFRKKDDKRDTTKEIIETKEGDVARLIAIDGKPLSADANQGELDRLNTLAEHPELQEHRYKREQKDEEFVDHLLGLLPDAFLYRVEGTAACGVGQCYRLSFTPNPKFVPPDMKAKFLRGVAGEVWIDQAQERMTRLNAHLISDVDFGFGILARLDKGGTVQIEQKNIGGNDWELTGLQVSVTGRALMVKALNFQIAEDASHFSPVTPKLTYREAIRMLKSSNPVE